MGVSQYAGALMDPRQDYVALCVGGLRREK